MCFIWEYTEHVNKWYPAMSLYIHIEKQHGYLNYQRLFTCKSHGGITIVIYSWIACLCIDVSLNYYNSRVQCQGKPTNT